MLWGHTTNLPGFLTLEAEGSKMRPMCRSFCSSCHFWYIKSSILFLIAKKVLYIQKKKYTILYYIYVYQLATVCFLCINKIQSNIANEKLQTTQVCAMDIRSFQPIMPRASCCSSPEKSERSKTMRRTPKKVLTSDGAKSDLWRKCF